MEMSVKNVPEFYDEFLKERMVGYRIDPNPRIKAAIDLIVPLMEPGAVFGDIGCGIGILAEAVAMRQPTARVFATDISAANIEYARRTVIAPNVHFFQADVTEQFDRLRAEAGRPFDVLALVDVIEHLPEESRPDLLFDLASLTKPDGLLALTYPSPEYQRYLMASQPEELQVIDMAIELESLLEEAWTAGWKLHSFRYVDIWLRNQYIHAVFVKCHDVTPTLPRRQSIYDRLHAYVDRKLFRPRRIRRYQGKPFENWPAKFSANDRSSNAVVPNEEAEP